MATWMRFGIGAAALALAVALGTAAYAMRGDDAPGAPPRALGRATDGGPAAPGDTTLAGEDADAGAAVAAMCAPGYPDCDDMLVAPEGGEDAARCAADGPGCMEPVPAACPVEGCDTDLPADCVQLETDPPTVSCTGFGCAEPMPADGGVPAPEPGLVDPPMDMPAPAVAGATASVTCEPPPPPCAPGDAGCLPPDCAISSDGAVSCPGLPACGIVESGPGQGEIRVPTDQMPCVVSPCLGNDPYAGVPADCASPPCRLFAEDQPGGAPCEGTDPCLLPAPLRDEAACKPGMSEPGSPGVSEPGGAGSGGSVAPDAPGADVEP